MGITIYVEPEVLRYTEHTQVSDIYSFGIIIYCSRVIDAVLIIHVIYYALLH